MTPAPIAVCDICDSPNVRWAYPCDHPERQGGFAMCPVCARLAERGDREGLAQRLARNLAESKLGRDWEPIMPTTRTFLNEVFWSHRTGERIPASNAPFDPTSKEIDPQAMAAWEGNTLTLYIAPKPGQPADTTFSAEAVENIGEQARAWFITRAWRVWQKTGRAPQEAVIRVTVELPGHELEFSVQGIRLLDDGSLAAIPDGRHRQGG